MIGNEIRIIVISDIHANLPALRCAIDFLKDWDYDHLIICGDIIGIGPYPAETVDLVLSMPKVELLMGNHESYFVFGLELPYTRDMTVGEITHHRWTQQQLREELRPKFARFPFSLSKEYASLQIRFLHYALDDSGRNFTTIIKHPSYQKLNHLFSNPQVDLICYGHDHNYSDLSGPVRYVNPGSLGCNGRPEAQFCLLEIRERKCIVMHKTIPYDPSEILQAYQDRQVPDRTLILKTFFNQFPK